MNEEKNPIDEYFDMKEGRVKLAKKQEDGPTLLLNKYLAMFRVITIIYQHGHWKCKGNKFYGTHLLFQRLYNDAAALVDVVAEKIIGIYGNDALKHQEQVSLIEEMFSQQSKDDLIENAIQATESLLELSVDLYDRLKELEDLTLGLDDMIMANASKLEEFVYLLKQSKD
jgi:starvation-inducible DNA-binding protein